MQRIIDGHLLAIVKAGVLPSGGAAGLVNHHNLQGGELNLKLDDIVVQG
jgi:hypothetical protein